MKNGGFFVGEHWVQPGKVWPSPDLTKVLVASDREQNWRHSFTGLYWIFDVASQTGEPLDPANPTARIQLAQWAPTSRAVSFTRDNNLYIRPIRMQEAYKITEDGGPETFNGVPDWVYEEEVFAGNSATWWSEDGKYIAFLRTDESQVPTYPIQYFVSRPSGEQPEPGLENYPEVRHIKYPKAGAPNPVVQLRFFSVTENRVFNIDVPDDFADDDRLITEVVWAGRSGKVLVRETNRESDLLKVVLMDVDRRTGKTVRTEDVNALDGGWMEVSQETTFIPGDPRRGRNHDGYIDTVIVDGFDHLGYFSPVDSAEPVLLTKGAWEVVKAPSAIDLKNNFIYFVATKDGSIERHVYKVKLDGTGLEPLTDVSKDGYYSVSFSSGAGYALLSYDGPGIPWQKVISTPSTHEQFDATIEENKQLATFAAKHELPIYNYQTITIDGVELNLLERRPPHFNEKKKYPVLFWMYQGPGSQTVDKKFNVDFQSYVASNLGYIVVTLDGRGTGYLGRDVRCATRGNIGYLESFDQIAAAKMWAKKKYVDSEKMAIWGWSYGGFMALKTLERDAGETFKYGMAVAPVTDWRYYDSIYTERYMHTPQHNPGGYMNATVADVDRLGRNVRFLIMHGVADDNVHMQSTLTLLDRLDLRGVENYDMHMFPDSNHGIYFHNANRIVYDKLNNWLINAFNGVWLKTANPTPVALEEKRKERRQLLDHARAAGVLD
ncbi:hypothetical protein P152DRAFT_460371 [Eremomyces bilateralis CBS 781.70]|uniref:dipeptidyl-peptidase IV n=1 Tax=Eremomyces bilateralis CBS 781.70 TaxID=1392243 RepID=A0A6G1FXQ4_9PEZI|nr:uncharacterized protein P152DRAFT_460371 [Eremomyces bilateralis CBS 781.70]KAF1810675.1 hypothetical protein P152DRAFT_460371 [Eremomyces bilateralis CBS 781.70]